MSWCVFITLFAIGVTCFGAGYAAGLRAGKSYGTVRAMGLR